MVRFKSYRNESSAIDYNIYIPIWFDLNINTQTVKGAYEDIYIPIWFDLNCNVLFSLVAICLFTFQYGSI